MSYLKPKFCFQQAVLRLAIGAAVGVVDTIVRAHDIPRAGLDRVLKWPGGNIVSAEAQERSISPCYEPKIQFMHCFIVDIGRHRGNIALRVSVRLLFVPDKVLRPVLAPEIRTRNT